jgi:hypothetical protein
MMNIGREMWLNILIILYVVVYYNILRYLYATTAKGRGRRWLWDLFTHFATSDTTGLHGGGSFGCKGPTTAYVTLQCAIIKRKSVICGYLIRNRIFIYHDILTINIFSNNNTTMVTALEIYITVEIDGIIISKF